MKKGIYVTGFPREKGSYKVNHCDE